MNFHFRLRAFPVGIALVTMFVAGASAAPYIEHSTSPTVPPVVPALAADTGPIGGVSAPNFRAIVKRYGPAVVGINVDGNIKVSDAESGGNSRPGPNGDDPFSQFFGNGHGPQGPVPMHGQGSGFIVGSDGLILTNAHVVRDASHVTVKLSDRREFKAKVLGIDPATDIAVLKIQARDLPTVQLGNSDQLAVGDYVLAIGEPYGFEESATSGIVSAKGRSLPGGASVPFIQTDAAVNPGNSGGPLFDSEGKVVGINSQIYSNTGGYEGLSFAIPIKVAMQVKDQIVANGRVQHALLGVTIQPLTQSLAQSFHLDKPDGALVSSVTPGSAAARAGIQPGDVILKYNDQVLADAGELSAQVGMAKPGDKIQLEVWRDRKQMSLDIKLDEATQVASKDDSRVVPQGKLGLAVRPLSPEERKDAGVTGGLVVEAVSGPAETAGIQSGDIVLSIDGTSIQSVKQLRDIVAKQNQQVALLIVRGDTRIFVPVPLA